MFSLDMHVQLYWFSSHIYTQLCFGFLLCSTSETKELHYSQGMEILRAIDAMLGQYTSMLQVSFGKQRFLVPPKSQLCY